MNERPTDVALPVHLVHAPPPAALRALRGRLDPRVALSLGEGPVPADARVLVTGRPTREQLEASPRLHTLIVPYAGIPAETRKLLLEDRPDLIVYNLHHNAGAAAELAMALMLAASKTLIPVDRRFRQHDWRSRYDGAPTLLLEGKTAVVLGLGAIGTRVAAACRGLGMRVVAVRRRPAPIRPDDIEQRPPGDLHRTLPMADVLFVTLPLTPATAGMIGEAELGLLPRTCVLVNVARGAIVDEQALYEALRHERIAAAGIDAWYVYPRTEADRTSTPPSRFPFHELDNVVMSPHRGGAFRVDELEQRRMHDLAESLNAIARGEPAPHRVDLEAGY